MAVYVDTPGNSLQSVTINSSNYNEIYLLDGNDTVYISGSDIPRLEAGSGNDYVENIGLFSGTFYGGQGNDTLIGNNGNNLSSDYLYGGDGVDVLSGRSGNDFLYGGRDDDDLYGGKFFDELYGDDGNDELFGEDNDDKLYGGSGNDALRGGTGNDRMSGDDGDDNYEVTELGDIVLEHANEGKDTIFANIDWTLGANLEDLILFGQASIDGTGNALNNGMNGNEVANVLSGLGGNDVLDGGAGADDLRGGTGNDTYVVDDAGDVVSETGGPGAGVDLVKASIDYTLTINVENLTLTGTNGISGYGNDSNNGLTGNTGANFLAGGLGNDTLTGGLGNDTFFFNTALNVNSNIDTITDFTNGFGNDDTIRLENAIFVGLANGALSTAAFKDIAVAGAKLDGDDRIIYDHNNGNLYFDQDGSGGTYGGIRFANLSSVGGARPILTEADFFVV